MSQFGAPVKMMVMRERVMLISFALAGCIAFSSCMKDSREPIIYLIPKDYRGWVEIDYEDASCPEAVLRNGHRAITVSIHGKGCTSSGFQTGWAVDQFIHVDEEGREVETLDRSKRVWGSMYLRVQDASGKDRRVERFFVGTEDEFRRESKGVSLIPGGFPGPN